MTLCFYVDELVVHIFCCCRILCQIRLGALNWMRILDFRLLDSIVDNFVFFDSTLLVRVKKRYRSLLLFAVIWSIWISRNAILFEGDNLIINNVISLDKSFPWDWFGISYSSNIEISFKDLCANHIACMYRVDSGYDSLVLISFLFIYIGLSTHRAPFNIVPFVYKKVKR